MLPPAEIKNLPLVDFVVDMKADEIRHRGALARLRNALADSPERQMRAWRLLARFGGTPTDGNVRKAEVVRVVAGLLAHLRLHHISNGKSFAAACQSLLDPEERKSLNKAEQPGPVSRRMQHLFAANDEEVCDRVRQLGRRLTNAKTEVALDFNRLHHDLIGVSGSSKRFADLVKARWAADFWGADDEENAHEPEVVP